MLKKIIALILCLATLTVFVSCNKNKDRVKYGHCEMILPLSSDFYEVEDENFDVTYSNGKYVVAVLRLSFEAAINEGIGETMTPHEFGRFWVEKCNRNAIVRTKTVTYCEYYEYAGIAEFYYLEAFLRSQYAYFVVLFASPSAYDDEAFDDFISYAEMIAFN